MKEKKAGRVTRRRLSEAAIIRALNAAAQDAVETHRRAGLPMVHWQDGKVVMVPVEQLPAVGKHRKSKSRRKSKRRRPYQRVLSLSTAVRSRAIPLLKHNCRNLGTRRVDLESSRV